MSEFKYEKYERVFNKIWLNDFKFDRSKKFYEIGISALPTTDYGDFFDITQTEFPYVDKELFWKRLDETQLDELKDNKAIIVANHGHEFLCQPFLNKLYKIYDEIPDYIINNLILISANSDITNLVEDYSKKYNKPKLNALFSYELCLTYYTLRTNGGHKTYMNMYFHPEKYKHYLLSPDEVYDRLVEVSMNENRNKKYTCLVRRPREERFKILSLLNYHNHLKDGYVSAPLEFEDNGRTVNVIKDNSYLLYNEKLKYKRYNQWEATYGKHGEEFFEEINIGFKDLVKKLPLVRDTDKFEDWGKTQNLDIMWENYIDSYLAIILETGNTGAEFYGRQNDRLIFTEKTLKAIMGGQIYLPYSWFGTDGMDVMKLFGFKKFKGVDYTYEKEIDQHKKFNLYWEEINRLVSMSYDELKSLWLENKDIIKHNIYNITHWKYPKVHCNYVEIK